MATFTSPTFSTSNQYIKYRLVITELSQSIVSNTTKINVKLQAWRTNDYSTYGSGTAYINLNGTEYAQAINYTQRIELNSYTVLFDQDFTITHDVNGSKAMSIGGWISHSQFSASEQTYSFNLTQIPRASFFIIADSNLYFGETLSLTITRADDSFLHDVKIQFGSYSQSFTNRTTSASYTIPDLWAGAIPNSITGTGTVTVTTKQNGVTLGSSSHNFTLNVPSDMIPSFASIATAPSPAYFSSYYLQGKSAIDIEIVGANGIYGSGIRSYSIKTTTNFNSAKRTATTPVITISGNVTITAVVTDTRGRTVTKTKTVAITAYSIPKLSAIVQRVNSEGIFDDSGTRVQIKPTVTITSVNGNNSITILRYRYKRKIDINYGSWINMANNDTYYFDADVNYDFDVQIEYKDAVHTSLYSDSLVPSSKRIMDIKAGGTGIAFGKAATLDNVAEFGWPVLFSGGTEGLFDFINYQGFATITNVLNKVPGIEIEVPANTIYIATAKQFYNSGAPIAVGASLSQTTIYGLSIADTTQGKTYQELSHTITGKTGSSPVKIYAFAKCNVSSARNTIKLEVITIS